MMAYEQNPQDEIITLRARVAELERDAARLDYLERERHSPTCRGRGNSSGVVFKWALKDRYDGERMTKWQPTLRAAIDAARGGDK